MTEQSPKLIHPPQWKESPHLSFAAQTVKIKGDPETPADFNRALNYLEAISAHFVEYGPLEDKTPFDVAYELSYHNAWHQFEVEQERKSGEKEVEYREISLAQLRAMSKRKLLALAEIGNGDETSRFVDQLIEQAEAEEEAFNQLMAPASDEP